MTTLKNIRGILADKTYVILSGVNRVTPISFYTEIIKDEEGAKRKQRILFFCIGYLGGEEIRFEQKRKNHTKPKRDTNDLGVLEIYIDEDISEFRDRLILELKRK